MFLEIKTMGIIEKDRDMIREKGFYSAVELVLELVAYCTKEGIPPSQFSDDITKILDDIVCDDIHSVEYANKATEDHKRKDLFYYNPDEFFCDGDRDKYIDNTEG